MVKPVTEIKNTEEKSSSITVINQQQNPAAEIIAPPPPAPPVINAVDEVLSAVNRLAEIGLAKVDDFNEGNWVSANGRPDWFNRLSDDFRNRHGEGLAPYRIWVKALETHRLTTSGAFGRPAVTPITRSLFPDLPSNLFNTKGFIQEEDLVWCVCTESVHNKLNAMGKKEAEASLRMLGAKIPGDPDRPEETAWRTLAHGPDGKAVSFTNLEAEIKSRQQLMMESANTIMTGARG